MSWHDPPATRIPPQCDFRAFEAMTIPLIHPENRAVRKACGTRLMSAEGSAQPPLPSCCCVLHLNVVSTTIVLTSLSRSRIVLSMSNRLINTGRKPRFDSIHQQAYLRHCRELAFVARHAAHASDRAGALRGRRVRDGCHHGDRSPAWIEGG